MTKSKSEKKSSDFETSLAELSQIVEELEHGGLSLEDSLKKFERGVALTRTCQETLKVAEQKVQILTQQNGQPALTPFDSENNS